MKKHFNAPEFNAHLFENKAESSNPDKKLFTRYSDAELMEFKDLIMSQLKEAATEYELLNRTLLRYSAQKKQTATFVLKEDDTEVYTINEIAQLAVSVVKHINALQKAI
jgi:DnaK suppressor protein